MKMINLMIMMKYKMMKKKSMKNKNIKFKKCKLNFSRKIQNNQIVFPQKMIKKIVNLVVLLIQKKNLLLKMTIKRQKVY